MALIAMAVPIIPGKTEQWKHFAAELSGPRKHDFEESRRRLGVRERVFLQQTPMGDAAIVTMEGANPADAFRHLVDSDDAFTKWFTDTLKGLHGFDMDASPPPVAELLIDSGS